MYVRTDVAQQSGGLMRVLALTHSNGSNRTFQKLMRSLTCAGHTVQVVAWDRDRKYETCADLGGIPHRFILHGGRRSSRWNLAWYPLWMLRLTVHLLKGRADLVWAANFETAVPAALAGLITKVRFVYYIHDNVSMTYEIPVLSKFLLRPLDAWTVRRASCVMVPHESRLEAHIRRNAARVLVLPNAPSLESAPPLLAGQALDEVRPFDVYVTGSLLESRGIGVLLRALKHNPDLRVAVAGPLSEPALGERLLLAPQVHYLGCLEHSRALAMYQEASAVIAFYDPARPINVHASPTKLYEAMMAGCPVIINSEAAMSGDVVRWGIGYACPYADHERLAEILREIRIHPQTAAEKGRRAREVFASEWAWEHFEPRLHRMIEELGDAICQSANPL